MTKRKLRQIPGFDGLRAIAILGIVFYHLIPRFVPGGFLGVTLFFSIMGFLMIYTTKSVIDGEDRRFSVPGYYKKKILRLYPPLIMVSLLSVLLLMILPLHYTKGTFGELASVLLGYNNWWQILKNSSYFTRIANASPFTHLWYMGLTIQYHLIWPFIVILLAKLRKGNKPVSDHVLLIIISVLCLVSGLEMAFLYKPGADPSRVYYGTDTRAYSLLAGMILALLPRDFTEWISEKLDRVPPIRYVIGGILLVLMVFMYFTVDGTHTATYRGLMQLFNLLAVLSILLLLVSEETIGKILELKPLAWIGKKSYIIYLVMYPAIFFTSKLLKKDHTLAGSIIALVVIFILTIAIDRADHFLRGKFGSEIVFKPLGKHSRKRASAAKPEKEQPAAVQKIKELLLSCYTAITSSYRNVIASLLVILVIASAGQSIYIHVAGPEDDSAIMAAQIEKNKQLLEEQAASSQDGSGETAENTAEGEPSDEGTSDEGEAAGDESSEVDATADETADTSVTAIGDSVMLGAVEQLQGAIPGIIIDANIGRQVRDTGDTVSAMEAAGTLGHTVILHLGTNGTFSQTTGQDLIDQLGPDRQIYWVNAYGHGITWANDANTRIIALCDANENLTYVDWAALAGQHPEWFYSDGIHLTPDGAAAYSDFIRQAIGR